MASMPPTLPEPKARQPLHLIWGVPVRQPAADPEPPGDQDQRQG